ncbi:MAG: hypothetical protein CM15mV6_1960 [uncultured marine virus]|nr:MAG: hypothetical protein CM15mV6_1960 [uncultured marine virus]
MERLDYTASTGEIYCGLYDYLEEFFNNKGYEYVVKQDDHYGIPQEDEEYVTPQSTALLLGLWVSLSRQGTTNYEAYIKHLSRVGALLSPQDQGNP